MDCKVGDRVHVAGTVTGLGFRDGTGGSRIVVVRLDGMNELQRQYVDRSAIVHVETNQR